MNVYRGLALAYLQAGPMILLGSGGMTQGSS